MVLVGVAAAIWSLFLHDLYDEPPGSDAMLRPHVAETVGSDAGFMFMPTDAQFTREYVSLECVDDSGGMPKKTREMTSPLPDQAVIDQFAAEVPKHGWVEAQRWTGGGNVLATGVRFSKTFGTREVELVVLAIVDSEDVYVEARIPCGERPFPIARSTTTAVAPLP